MNTRHVPPLIKAGPMAVFLLVAAGCPASADTVPWHEESADIRFRIETQPDLLTTGAPCAAVLVSLCPVGRSPAESVPSVYDAAGRPVGRRVLHARRGEPMTVLFAGEAVGAGASTGAPPYSAPVWFLYLGGTNRLFQSESWAPRAGIVLETRTSDSAPVDLSIEAYESLWESAHLTNGAQAVDSIHHAFPILPADEPLPGEYATHQPAGLLLNRYTGYFRFAKNHEILRAMRDTLAGARLEKQDILEKVEKAHFKLREAEYELGMAGLYPDVVKTSPEVLKERLYRRLREHDDLAKSAGVRVDRVIQSSSNTIAEIEAGLHTFHIGARAGAHLLIDGQPALTWSADRPLNRYLGGYINLDSVTLSLGEGTHKLEYLHYAQADDFTATVAWRPPGDGVARTVAAADFEPIARGEIAAVEFRNRSDEPLLCAWRIADDLRHPGVGDMVFMDFSIVAPRPDGRYAWEFGDGSTAEGPAVRHLYLLTGFYSIRVAEYARTEQEPSRTMRQEVHARVLWDKHRRSGPEKYERAFTDTNLANAGLPALFNAYDFARKSATERHPLRAWREHVRKALFPRMEAFPPDRTACLVTIADEASSPYSKAYEEARLAYTTALKRLKADDPARSEALLGYADLLVNCHGDTDTALKTLNQLPNEEALSTAARHRARLLRADILLAQGKPDEAAALLKTPGTPAPEDATRLAIRQRAEIRYAQGLASKENPVFDELMVGMEKLDGLSADDPSLILSPEWNLARLDIYLGRREYGKALHLANRLLTMEIPDVLRPNTLARRARAMYETGDMEGAKTAFQELGEAYPHNAEATRLAPPDL